MILSGMRLLFGVATLLLLPWGTVLAQDADDGFMDPFVQSDFNILTGDVQRPNGIFWHNDFLYVGCAGDWTLYRIDDTTGSTITYIFGVKNSHSMFVEDGDSDVVVWVADFQDNKISRISQETGLVVIRDGLAAPWGIAPSLTDESFFITEWGSDNLINMTREGDITVVAGDFEDPSGLVVTDELLYVANNASARRAVEWIDLSDGASTEPQSLVSGLQNVTNLVLGPDGYLYMAYALGTRGVVGRIDPQACREQGGCANVDVELVVWTELAAPLAGLVITPDMRLYVHTMFGTEIYWLELEADASVSS